MSEERTTGQQATRTPEMPVRRPFPLVRVLVSLFGIAAGVWLWLGSGWAWHVTPKQLVEGKPPIGLRTWEGRYVSLRAGKVADPEGGSAPGHFVATDPDDPTVWIAVKGERPAKQQAAARIAGRVSTETLTKGKTPIGDMVTLDATRGRMNLTSAAAVLIALWGAVLIYFNVAFWLRRSRVPTATAAPPPARPPAAPDDA